MTWTDCSRNFYDKRISAEVDGEVLGDEFKGYLFRISGGNDKQGFAMVQGVLSAQRVRLLLTKGVLLYTLPVLGWLLYTLPVLHLLSLHLTIGACM